MAMYGTYHDVDDMFRIFGFRKEFALEPTSMKSRPNNFRMQNTECKYRK